MDYFIMRAHVNTYAICIYVIIYVFIGAPQIVRIPGMIQLGSWEFCWKYQLKPIPCANSLVFVLYHRQ